MADYYTNFSFMIALTPEQQAWALKVHSALQAVLGTDLEETPLIMDDADGAATAVKSLTFEFPDDAATGFECEAQLEGLWVHNEEGGIELTARWVQLILVKYDIAEAVSFEWSNDCSKPRLDAYGGGACVITRTDRQFFNTSMWVDQQLEKIEREKIAQKIQDARSFAEDALDDTVHDTASSPASEINNGGVIDQLMFLLENGWTEQQLMELAP